MIFTPTAFFDTPTLVASIVDPFPSALNSGLVGRFEVTNVLSWPGSGVIMNNLATASLYATSSTATIWSASAVDTTNGIQLNGTSTRVDFGIISTYNSGSYVMNSAMTASNEFTVVYLAQLDSTGLTTQCGLSAWNDYFADTAQSKYISLIERTSTGGNAGSSLRSNNSYNNRTFSSYFTNDVLKMYGTRLSFTTNGESYWRGTSNFVNFTPTGTTLNSDGGAVVARNAPWTFGTRQSTTLGSFYSRFWKGNLYAAYFWSRRLSDVEMGDLQTYLNTYVKTNS